MVTSSVVDATGIVVAGTPQEFRVTIQEGGVAADLTGKTVTATVRAASAPATPIHASLEGAAVTLTTAASGIVTFTLTAAMSALLDVPDDPQQTRAYLLQLVVTTDDYVPQVLRFKARKAMAAAI